MDPRVPAHTQDVDSLMANGMTSHRAVSQPWTPGRCPERATEQPKRRERATKSTHRCCRSPARTPRSRLRPASPGYLTRPDSPANGSSRAARCDANRRSPIRTPNPLFWKGVLRERATGIEPAFSAWEADVLPLNYARERVDATRSTPSVRERPSWHPGDGCPEGVIASKV